MQDLLDRIQERLDIIGKSASAASTEAGFGNSYIRDIGRKSSVPSFEKISRLAVVLQCSPEYLAYGNTNSDEATTVPVTGLRVEGISKAGHWLDISLTNDNEHEREVIPAIALSRFAHARQYALQLSGDSMNKRYPDGSYVTAVDWGGTGLELKEGMALHIERHNGGLVETTVKVYAIRDGKRWLDPDSTNDSHKPIEIHGDESTTIEIKGLITGSWMPSEF